MHPILFTIPLPKTHVPAMYFYLAVIALGLLYAAVQLFVYKEKANAAFGAVIAAVGGAGWAGGILEGWIADKDTPAGMIPIGPLPIYSYGVMLGLSLVVGWYLTLGLAKRDGLPQETMANNYVITAVAAIAGSRILYVITNPDQFKSLADVFALRNGGLVAYGGFLGGLLGSLFYLRSKQIPLLPWADVAVPSLASGLMITRIGCYLFGCDFGRPLCRTEDAGGLTDYALCASPEAAPAWLQKLGTFPRWAAGLVQSGGGISGSPAWRQHVDAKYIDDSALTSLPVHPTQLYESLVGAGLLGLLLVWRRKQKFRGEIFLLFTFAYGVCRYLIEILRDDLERGSLPFSGGRHTMVALGLAILAAGFALGFAQRIRDMRMRRVAQVLSFVPAVAFYIALRPASWSNDLAYQWSTSQFVGITTGFAACVAFSVLYKAALAHPEAAMRIPLPPPEDGEEKPESDNVADDDEEEDDDEKAPAKKPVPAKKPAGKAASSKPVAKAAAKKPAARAKAEEEEDAGADAAGDGDSDGEEEEKPSKPAGKKAATGKPDQDKPAGKKAPAAKSGDGEATDSEAGEKAD